MPLLPVCQFLWAQKRLERIRHAISATSQYIMESLTFEHLSIAPRLVIVAFSVVVRSSSRIRLPNLFFCSPTVGACFAMEKRYSKYERYVLFARCDKADSFA